MKNFCNLLHYRADTADNIKKYKDRLNNTTLLSQDYKTVIKKYDSVDTLFYLDPPYENSEAVYKRAGVKNPRIDYNEMNDILSNIKGKFILSINDSELIRSTFKNYTMSNVIVNAKRSKDMSKHDRQELVITNF